MLVYLLNFFYFLFLQPHLWHMEVPRLEVELELQLLAYAKAAAHQIRAISVTYATACGSTKSLAH